MGRSERTAAIRRSIANLLETKGYAVRDESSGSGVPKLSRLEISKGMERLICVVKIAFNEHRRISFVRNSDGSYKALSDSDRVIYAHPVYVDGQTQVFVAMFGGETVKRAFEVNFEARKGTDQEGLPMWLGPEPESGSRFIGSGFRNEALWSEITPLHGPSNDAIAAEQPAPLSPVQDESATPISIMEQVKSMLSKHMGVRPDQLEIDVRVRL